MINTGLRQAFLSALILVSVSTARAEPKLRPVTVTVLDQSSRRPIDQFSYRWSARLPDGKMFHEWDELTAVSAVDGRFQLSAPESAELWVDVVSPDY